MNRTVLSIIIIVAFAVSACAGRKPNPVAEVQSGDAALSCRQLSEEIEINNQLILSLVSEGNRTVGKNVVAGVAAAVVFAPALFFMDVKGASGEEARAYHRRNQSLLQRYRNRGCKPDLKVVEMGAAGVTPTDAQKREMDNGDR